MQNPDTEPASVIPSALPASNFLLPKGLFSSESKADFALAPTSQGSHLLNSTAKTSSRAYGRSSTLDHFFKAALAKLTFGITPIGMAKVWFDWSLHLCFSPSKQVQLLEKAQELGVKFTQYAIDTSVSPTQESCVPPQGNDNRFSSKEWCMWPFNLIHQSFLAHQEWWQAATTKVDGVAEESEKAVAFTARQLLDLHAPCNIPWVNPQVLHTTFKQGGMNFVRGLQYFTEDIKRHFTQSKPVGCEAFNVGKNLAITPGQVVYRNHLMELIQYTPTTSKVHAEPILFVPAWIMKYYILDLSKQNSLVRYLVDKGHTVFMISWRNPRAKDREFGMEAYRKMGPKAALEVINRIVPNQKVHAVGYCLGGTLLAIVAAAMARKQDDRLASLTLLATQVDFTEAGELMLFVRESEITYLEHMMWDSGYLDGSQMAGAFQILRSNDLIGSRILNTYLLGQRQPINDLMAWNADTTRMPYRMHSEYLRRLFLNNELASGRYVIDGRPVVINDIRVPIAAIGTIKDHVAPWRSVYKIHLLADSDEITFILVSGGHNAGIISEPNRPRRSYQMRTSREQDIYMDPDTWQKKTEVQQGSWWPAWQKWLLVRSSAPIDPPTMGAPDAGYPPVAAAPGQYVHQT